MRKYSKKRSLNNALRCAKLDRRKAAAAYSQAIADCYSESASAVRFALSDLRFWNKIVCNLKSSNNI